MKTVIGVVVLATSMCLWLSFPSYADEEFYGIIESRPEGKVGTWVIGGRDVEVTERTKLEEDHGPLVIGVCAEVEYEGGMVEEIESEAPAKCKK